MEALFKIIEYLFVNYWLPPATIHLLGWIERNYLPEVQ